MTRTARRFAGGLAAAAMLTVGALAAPAAAAPRQGSGATLHVGSVTLHRCGVTAGAWCGSIRRSWDPTGSHPGTVRVGFAYVPARDRSTPAVGTLVPHEGGPGYSSTGSVSYYAPMYGPLLQHRNLLVMDQRGTGRSEPVNCPSLQHLVGPYSAAAQTCAAQLGQRADEYGTALAADDLAAVVRRLEVGPIDLYGDSYGTFFAQVFAGRHQPLLRSLTLDSAYPTYGETAWYPTQTPAMRRAFVLACSRSTACASAGRGPMALLRAVLAQVRVHPYRGMSRDGDGTRMHVVVDGPALVSVAFGATYGPEFYREFPAALRAALHRKQAPLLRLVAEAIGASSDAGNPADYSEGLDAAVSCHDYPQLYDMTATPRVRKQQLAAAITAEEASDPSVYAPFTVREYLRSDWQMADWCTTWPVAQATLPAGPPTPPSGHYGNVPTLVLSGELDSITTAAEGAMVVSQFPNAQQVHFANSFHVTAAGDSDHCAENVVRAFVRRPNQQLSTTVTACATRIPPVRTMGRFPRSVAQVPAATNVAGSTAGVAARKVAVAAAETVTDVIDRWYNNYSGHGYGLHGGTWSYTGYRATKYRFSSVRFVPGLAVSGTAVWLPYQHRMTVNLSVRTTGLAGALHGHWDTRAAGAIAHLHGTLRGAPLAVRFVAP